MSGPDESDRRPSVGSRVPDPTRNEQTKLLATALNNIAVAFIVIGGVTPLMAVSFGIANAPPLDRVTATFALVWLCAGGILHWIARRILLSLKP